MPTPATPEPFAVRHWPERHSFEAIVDDASCVLAYRIDGPVMSILHTGVPPPVEGRGIAAALTDAALAYARSVGLKVRPLCSYARAYFRRFPEAADLLA